MSRPDALDRAVGLALEQDGVLSRVQAREVGVDRWMVAHQLAHDRWQAHGSQVIAVHRLPLSPAAHLRATVWNASENAVLDGSSALRWHGLENFDDGAHVLVPWPHRPDSWRESHIHSSRLWAPDDFVTLRGLAVTRPEVAAVRAGMWARSDRAAATVLAMAVQQRVVSASRLLLEARRLNRHKRRPFILLVAGDIADGAQALSELDFGKLCRLRGLPEPSRQCVRKGAHGRVFLDVLFEEFDVAVEVEGAHHDAPENAVDDALRQNALVIARLGVLRLPVLGLRSTPDEFMDQVEALLRRAGWRSAA